MLRIISFILISISFINSSNAQFLFEEDREFTVKYGSDTLTDPWGGGLNFVQVSNIDYNFDGLQDLFIFDRSNNQIRLFEHKVGINGSYYSSVYNASDLFPEVFKNRVQLLDYDLDGRQDIFASYLGSIRVYRNTGDASNGLTWELRKDYLISDYNGINSALLVNSVDIPAIEDIDFDGDLDILTFNGNGERVQYHKNLSQETYGHSDSLLFSLKNECWGKFIEDALLDSIELYSTHSFCNGGSGLSDIQKSAHFGGSLLAIDFDNSGVVDLILGDAGKYSLKYLISLGNVPNMDSPIDSVYYAFPSSSTPTALFSFPAAYYIDVNFDGVSDVVVGSNESNSSNDLESVWLYQNLNTDVLPSIQFVQENFLQDQMIEVGTNSIPSFFDYNKDGLLDLVVSNRGRYKDTFKRESALMIYANIGTSLNPVYQYLTDDYHNFASAGFGYRMFPAFGDLNGDNQPDLIIGNEDGNLHMLWDNAPASSDVNFVVQNLLLEDNNGDIINVGGDASPQIIDLDLDGLNDLVIGNESGILKYYRNTGTITIPEFTLVNDDLGMIDVNFGAFQGNAVPHFVRENDTLHLFVGCKKGHVFHYDNIENNLSVGSSFNLVSDDFRQIHTGGYSVPFVEDVDNDNRYNLFVGNDLGGVWTYEHNPQSVMGITQEETKRVHIIPNPVKNNFTLTNINNTNIRLKIYNISGKEVWNVNSLNSNSNFNISNLSSGMYILHVYQSSGKLLLTEKIIKLD